MYATGPVELHIVCDEEAKKVLEISFNLVYSPAYNVVVRYYMPTWDQLVQRIDREGTLFTDHGAGMRTSSPSFPLDCSQAYIRFLAGLAKLFLHEIIPVKKSIFVDTDALFISDPRHLWNIFKGVKPETGVVMSSHPDGGASEWHEADKICSCVMLLDLEKLRTIRLMDSSIYRQDPSGPPAASPPAFRAKFGEPDSDGKFSSARLGDQGYWWAIVDHLKDLWEPLSFDFEVTSCLMNMYETRLGDVDIGEEQEMYNQGHVANTPQSASF